MLDPSYFRDVLAASDPDLARLRQAGRATLAAMAATAVLHGVARALGQPTTAALIGVNMAMLGAVIVNDPTPRAQRITTVCMPFVASSALCLGALVSPFAWLRNTALIAIVFGAVLMRRFGPRGTGLGMVGFLSYFFALFFHASPTQLPLMMTGVFVASGLAYATRFWVLRERPQAVLRRRISAFRRTLALALYHLARASTEGRWTPHRERAVGRAMNAVNDAALSIDDQLERLGPKAFTSGEASPELPARIFALELALEGVLGAVERLLATETTTAGERAAAATALHQARSAVRPGDTILEPHTARALDLRLAALPPDDAEGGSALGETRRAIEELLRTAWRPWRPSPPELLASTQHTRNAADPTDASGTPSAPPPVPAESSLRLALQAALAATLALWAGEAVSPSRGYWAVIAAFVVFTRASTVGATVARAWQRVIGTVVGVFVGILVAHAVQGRVYAELAVVFACMFVGYYTLQVAYAWMVASITTLIAVLYSLLGRFSPELLYLRVVETLIGAGIGTAVAALVFPAYASEKVRAAMADALRDLGDYLNDTVVERSASRADLLDSTRALDRKLRDVRADIQALSGGPPLRTSREMARVFLPFSAVFFYARTLVDAEWLAASDPEGGCVRAAGHRLADNARALAEALEGRGGEAITPGARTLEAGQKDLTDAEARLWGSGSAGAALKWLERIDASMVLLDRVVRETELTRAHRRRGAGRLPAMGWFHARGGPHDRSGGAPGAGARAGARGPASPGG
ncbi:FUSC family protein [Chondromyces crocatus]|uniref:FUSC family protein n=1 Tax=Chondromyces crocatus TaxID=52 RepID=UPI00146FCD97|nr:FUSC family protein [Chondromyces crocatus]